MTDKNNLQDDLKQSAHKIWLAGLGALAAAEEEGGKIFDRLIERGSEVEAKGKKKAKSAKKKVEKTLDNAWEGIEDGFEAKVANVLGSLGVPTRDEIRTLTERVEQLAAKLEASAPKKRTTRRSSAKTTSKTASKTTTKRATSRAKKS